MLNPSFDRPRTKTLYFLALPNRNRPILVPRNLPISFSGLIEENATHRERFSTEQRVYDWLNRFRRCHFTYHREIQYVSLGVLPGAHLLAKTIHNRVRQAIGNDGKAFLFKTLC